jgi:TolB-like protein/Flp pilus assembly protein TadD
MLKMIGKTISHYRILEKLGEGGMGVVYKAEDTTLKRTVALKFLPSELTRDPEARKRLYYEARAASSLEDTRVCTIHAIEETEDGQVFIAMPCYEGESLKERIAHGPMKLEDAVETALQIARGLAAAHEKGIVHRDIKPANIMITSKGQVKIMDFGLAKLSGATKLTKTGTTIGTVAYMSPEQARGSKVDHRTDIWSLGVLIYEMVSGRKPFEGDYEQAVLYSIMNDPSEPLTGLRTGIPLDLEKIVDKCLEKESSRRYQHIDEVAVDLKRIGESVSGKVSGGKIRIRRNKKMAWYAVPVILIVLFSVWIFLPYGPLPWSRPGSVSRIMKIVVLPFENLGHEGDTYFADGITEEITSRLSRLDALGVISRQSALHYAGKDFTVEQIGRELRVDYILGGTVRWAREEEGPGRVRITPHLIRVKDDTEIWNPVYEHVLEDIFHTQSDIAHKVVEQIGINLMQPQIDRLRHQPTENIAAYQAFLRGRYYTARPHFTGENWEKAIRDFQTAVRLDTGFALAQAELAKAHARLYYLRQDLSPERLEMAEQAAGRAMRLDPDAPGVRLAIGYYYLWAHRDHEKALKEWEIAEKELANNVDILKTRAVLFEPEGRLEEGIEVLKKAFELSPKDASIASNLTLFYWLMRDYTRAMEAGDLTIELEPDGVWPYLYKAFIIWSKEGPNRESRALLSNCPATHDFYYWSWYWQELGEKNYQKALELLETVPGDWVIQKMSAAPKVLLAAFVHEYLGDMERARRGYEASIPLLQSAIERRPDDPRYHSSLGLAYAGLGMDQEALREGKRAVDLLPLSEDALYGTPYVYDLAVIHTMTSDVEAAIEELKMLFTIPSFYTKHWLEMDVRLFTLRDNPGFKALVEGK